MCGELTDTGQKQLHENAYTFPLAFPKQPSSHASCCLFCTLHRLSSCRGAHLLLKEGMHQRLRGRDPLVRVDGQAAVQEVIEVVQLPRLCLVHAARCDHEARAEVPSWLYHGQYSDCCLQVRIKWSAPIS